VVHVVITRLSYVKNEERERRKDNGEGVVRDINFTDMKVPGSAHLPFW
jgi:hypothetical protein